MGRVLVILLLMVFSGQLQGSYAQENIKPLVAIGTGGVTGVYYAAGHAVAKLFARTGDAEDFRLAVESSEGSVENINRVSAGEWGFGIARADTLNRAMHGEGPWEGSPREMLRAVAVLHQDALTVIAAAGQGLETPLDLKGKRVGNGLSGSLGEESIGDILTLYGLDPVKDLTLVKTTTVDAPELLQKGMIDAYFYTVGHPNTSVYDATFGPRRIKLLPIDDRIADLAISRNPWLNTTAIPVAYYQRLENTEPVATLGVKAILFTSAAMPDHQVAALLEALLADFSRFQRQHPAFAELTAGDLVKGASVPLHPAASVVYKEKGMLK